MDLISESMLKKVGFENYAPSDFQKKNVTLRDGRAAWIWVNRRNGHGILDESFWADSEYYKNYNRKPII